MPNYRGPGLYQPAGRKGGSLGPAAVVVSGGFGDHGQTVFRDTSGFVSVTQATGTTFGGRFHALLSGRRRLFSAYGAWRCTVLR